MAVRTLYGLFSGAQGTTALRNGAILSAGGGAQAAEAYAIAARAIVAAITDTSVIVQFRGQMQRVRRATDEPVFPGQSVFVSLTQAGQLVLHGSAR